jgi:uncharacterized membrane protein YfcA
VAVSAASAMTATVAHWRGGRIEWRLFWLMAPPSLVGGAIGGLLSGLLPQRLLLAAIAAVVFYGAFEIRRRIDAPPRPRSVGGTAAAIAIAFAVGVLGGLVGLILGTLRLPAMVRWLGTSPKLAVGTNAATGVVVGVGGLAGHLAGGVDWALLGAGCLGAVPGAWLGARLTGRLDDRGLLRAISLVLLLAGAALGLEAVLG